MSSESPRADVEARLEETAEAMSDRLSSLEEEISATGTSLRDWVAQNPWKSVGGMLAAGVTVGMLFGGGSRRRIRHSDLLDQYIEALGSEVDEAVAAGKTPGQALEEALRDQAPLVVSEQNGTGDSESSRSFLGEGVRFVLRTAFREVGRDLLLSLLDGSDVSEAVGDGLSE